jgi:hypothetical protein
MRPAFVRHLRLAVWQDAHWSRCYSNGQFFKACIELDHKQDQNENTGKVATPKTGDLRHVFILIILLRWQEVFFRCNPAPQDSVSCSDIFSESL